MRLEQRPAATGGHGRLVRPRPPRSRDPQAGGASRSLSERLVWGPRDKAEVRGQEQEDEEERDVRQVAAEGRGHPDRERDERDDDDR